MHTVWCSGVVLEGAISKHRAFLTHGQYQSPSCPGHKRLSFTVRTSTVPNIPNYVSPRSPSISATNNHTPQHNNTEIMAHQHRQLHFEAKVTPVELNIAAPTAHARSTSIPTNSDAQMKEPTAYTVHPVTTIPIEPSTAKARAVSPSPSSAASSLTTSTTSPPATPWSVHAPPSSERSAPRAHCSNRPD
ncbi:hypothetical protein J1614_004162 [Plenodomus biglobosus]|nr:hypothetical protein J1614_004162 [Plenodomus biglobosus]